MAAIAVSESSLATLKKALREEMPEIRSSHLSEALAAALGRRTHAALRSELPGFQDDPPIELLNEDDFVARLCELGYPAEEGFVFDLVENADLFPTVDASSSGITYNTDREKAWRNLMVSAVNAGLQQKLFSLREDDNRWPNADHDGHLFNFTLPNGWPARGYVRDIGYAELSVHAAVYPKGNALRAANAGFAAGEAFGKAWLERRNGAWLQSSPLQFNCRKVLLKPLADLQVSPRGYGDRGRVIM